MSPKSAIKFVFYITFAVIFIMLGGVFAHNQEGSSALVAIFGGIVLFAIAFYQAAIKRS